MQNRDVFTLVRAPSKSAAIAVTKDSLVGGAIGNRILNLKDLQKGSFGLLLPVDKELPVDASLTESLGGNIRSSAAESLGSALRQEFRDGDSIIAKVELATPQDPWLSKFVDQKFLYRDDEVYIVVENVKSASEDALVRFASIAFDFRGAAAVGNFPVISSSSRSISDQDILAITEATHLLIVLAFDGDSYIVWSEDCFR